MKDSQVSQKSIYFWNLLGNLAAAGVSVLYLMIVSRLTDAFIADKFSLSYSIGNLWVIIGLFQVRNYQGTDVKNQHTLTSYFLARFLTTVIMLLTALPYFLFLGYSFSEYSVLLVALFLLGYRVCDAWSDLFQGQCQKNERLDIAGKLMTGRYTISVFVLCFILILTKNLVFATSGLFLFNLFFILLGDYAKVRKFERIDWANLFNRDNIQDSVQILKVCFPLFSSGFLINLIFNEPKQAIEVGLSKGILEQGMQRDYNILFMPAFFMSLCILVIRPLMTDLASLWHNRNMDKFHKVHRKIYIYLVIAGIIAVILAYFMGIPILSFVFGVNLQGQELVLTILLLSGVCYSLALVIENIVTIFRYQKYLLIVYVLVYLFSKIVTLNWILDNGLLGASLSFLCSMFLYLLGNGLVYLFIKNKLLLRSE